MLHSVIQSSTVESMFCRVECSVVQFTAGIRSLGFEFQIGHFLAAWLWSGCLNPMHLNFTSGASQGGRAEQMWAYVKCCCAVGAIKELLWLLFVAFVHSRDSTYGSPTLCNTSCPSGKTKRRGQHGVVKVGTQSSRTAPSLSGSWPLINPLSVSLLSHSWGHPGPPSILWADPIITVTINSKERAQWAQVPRFPPGSGGPELCVPCARVPSSCPALSVAPSQSVCLALWTPKSQSCWTLGGISLTCIFTA